VVFARILDSSVGPSHVSKVREISPRSLDPASRPWTGNARVFLGRHGRCCPGERGLLPGWRPSSPDIAVRLTPFFRPSDGAAKTEPTLAIGSGRGLYLLWLRRPIPRAALPRRTACQKVLWEVLKRLGADRTTIGGDRESWASRIRSKALRQSTNGGSGPIHGPFHSGSSILRLYPRTSL
jgi:hypothetical protein